jgi:succinate dehydrogenase / fumarate reductase cytochrome b subunit
VYRLPLAAVLSITHRISGVALCAGMLLLTCWVTEAASGPDRYEALSAFLNSWLGVLILFGFSVALFFHLCNGIRHLVWDSGRSFEKADTARTNIFVLLGTVVLTAAAWLLALA